MPRGHVRVTLFAIERDLVERLFRVVIVGPGREDLLVEALGVIEIVDSRQRFCARFDPAALSRRTHQAECEQGARSPWRLL